MHESVGGSEAVGTSRPPRLFLFCVRRSRNDLPDLVGLLLNRTNASRGRIASEKNDSDFIGSAESVFLLAPRACDERSIVIFGTLLDFVPGFS